MTAGEDSAGLVWFRNDLRLEDNPTWADATRRHDRVVPVFVASATSARSWVAQRSALIALDHDLRSLGGRLLVGVGAPADVIRSVASRHGVSRMYWTSAVDPGGRSEELAVAAATGLQHTSSFGSLVHDPFSVRSSGGSHYKVFSAFLRRWLAAPVEVWTPARRVEVVADPGVELPAATGSGPSFGADVAHDRLSTLIGRLGRYDASRQDLSATSGLSVDLALGTISPREVVRSVDPDIGAPFLRQLAWRDFFAHALFGDPASASDPVGPRRVVRWEDDDEAFSAWSVGETGYPLVDAAMRQLAVEGLMHGRLRMLVASFLTKDLLVDWRKGEAWFRQHLLDADPAQNIGNWRWMAGVGLDNARFLRILNPVTQSKRLDPSGAYIRRWIPELRSLDADRIHEPWKEQGLAPYPAPIVEHAVARQRAMEAFVPAGAV